MTLRTILDRVFPGNPHEDAARALYVAVVEQARAPVFYARLGVPDSVDGRFELLLLHCFLAMRRLRGLEEQGAALSQTLFDTLIYDMDQSLRESGVGDLKVGPRLRQMAEAFYGRMKAYDAGLAAEDGGELEEALRRNLYGTLAEPAAEGPATIAAYLRRQEAALAKQKPAELLRGEMSFAPPPDP